MKNKILLGGIAVVVAISALLLTGCSSGETSSSTTKVNLLPVNQKVVQMYKGERYIEIITRDMTEQDISENYSMIFADRNGEIDKVVRFAEVKEK